MTFIKVTCVFCGKKFFKELRRVNEAKKFGWRTYCSLDCQYKARNKRKVFRCSNTECQNTFKRTPNEISSTNLYCSRSCAAHMNNLKFPKRKRIIIKAICRYCGKEFIQEEDAIYCSRKCKDKAQVIPKEEIFKQIKEFYKRNQRIPLKREFSHYSAVRARFGTWNKAIKSAGFEPNPVMFAKKFTAKDGHKCDSFAEKIIDDWFYEREIEHGKEVSYPENRLLSADFEIGNNLIEYFGLNGVIDEYDEHIKEKRKLCKKYKLPLIEIFPKDLFPINRLSQIIKIKL